ncbi:MAG: DNA polymerase I [Duodenibacillus sp.]|nr:DNA polymerase I [Duodenibacillus sp.]
MSKILLIDGSNYLFRAFHALPPLTTRRGEPTGAIKGFHSMLNTVRGIVKPDYVACVFDAPGRNFRHDMFPEYKANRPPMPDELRVQIEPIFELVRLMGIPLIQVAGVEADDVLATLACRAKKQGMDVMIATGDKDMAQLVDDKVTLINTMTRSVYDRDGVFEKYGVYPERIIDYLALMGDKVDNVPGINKCGPKTAAKWIAQYGDLESIKAHAEEIGGKIGEYLRQGLPFLDVAKALVTINCEAPVEEEPEALIVREPDGEALDAFFVRWEIRSGVRKAAAVARSVAQPAMEVKEPRSLTVNAQGDLFALMPEAVPSQEVVAVSDVGDWTVCADETALRRLAERLAGLADQTLPVALAVLTDRTHFMSDVTVGLGIAVTALERYYIPVRHVGGGNATSEVVRALLGEWFAGPCPKVCHDAKYVRHVLSNDGLTLGGVVHDTMLMSYVIEAHLKHDIERLAARYCASAVPSEDDYLGKGASRRNVMQEPIEAVAGYLTQQAAVIRTVAAVLLVQLPDDSELGRLYAEMELPVSRVLWEMERTGVLVDPSMLNEQSQALSQGIAALEEDIYAMAGKRFNIASPKQLSDVLFNQMGLPPKGKKLASGAYSTGEEVLSELALDFPMPKKILEYRRLSKLKSTYTDKLPQLLNAVDARIHTTFGQATAVTGRLASSEPNLQNIPVRTEEGRRVREAFVAPKGCRIVSADYSQIELRIMAHISGDEGLLKAFALGHDVHRATAAEVFGVELDAVTSDQRRMAKVINFGLIYGMSAWGLRQNLGVEKNVAEHYIAQYFARYPAVARYMETTKRLARQNGYVQTAFGRRLWLPDIMSTRVPVRNAAERAAINAPMQGTAADLIKKAMIDVRDWLIANAKRSRLVLQVHDELILEVPEDEVDEICREVPRLMAQVADLKVPLIAEVGVADNWEAAH